jgi:hypothetical protein
VDAILEPKGTQLEDSEERQKLARCFAPISRDEFMSIAFTASEYEETAAIIKTHAPEVLPHIKRPVLENDFTVVGHGRLDLPFRVITPDRRSIRHTLRDGTFVQGAQIASKHNLLYSNGLIRIPADNGKGVYLYQPADPSMADATEMAAAMFKTRGEVSTKGLTVSFPKARTERLPDYQWVTQLRSKDDKFRVESFIGTGEAILNEKGFFTRETQVIEVLVFCVTTGLPLTSIDGPFFAFFADDTGVHAAAWFDHDSFSPYE